MGYHLSHFVVRVYLGCNLLLLVLLFYKHKQIVFHFDYHKCFHQLRQINQNQNVQIFLYYFHLHFQLVYLLHKRNKSIYLLQQHQVVVHTLLLNFCKFEHHHLDMLLLQHLLLHQKHLHKHKQLFLLLEDMPLALVCFLFMHFKHTDLKSYF